MSAVQRPRTRLIVVAVVFAALFVLLAFRAADLTVLRGPALKRLAALQHQQQIELVPRRGPIVDRGGEALALSLDVPSIFVRPAEFVGQEAKLPALAAALGTSAPALAAKIAGPARFVWLKRQALPREGEAVSRLGLHGVYLVSEARRFYPLNTRAAHVLGFAGVDSQGLEGIERRLDDVIRGRPQYLQVSRDAHGREMFTGGSLAPPPQGNRVELTIDAAIQDATERELAAGVAAAKAAGGAAIVMDPLTGEVLALANQPTFNPNKPGEPKTGLADPRWRDRVRNRAITDPYEPGSTFKAILAAAAIDEGVVTPAAMIDCENGRFRIGKWTIHDVHGHDWLSFAEVIQYSSNIGATKVGELLGAERYYRYLRAFNFGERTGIELQGETRGILRPVESWARIDLATHSFGQGIAVTPLQMVVAFGAIANGGRLMRPYLVRRIVAPDGRLVLENAPVVVRQVIRPETARVVTGLLRRAVEEEGGTGARARIDGFSVAGKTGTAQKPDLRSGGYSSKRIGSFVGFVPADSPRVVVVVMIDEPKTSSYGGVVAAPVFRGIASAALARLGVGPSAPLVQLAAAPPAAGATPPAAHTSPRAANGPAAVGSGMPSFLGLSLREALTRAQASGWEVQVTGSGWVVAQTPSPGSALVPERRLALQLAAADGGGRP